MQFDLLISGRIPLARVGISWSGCQLPLSMLSLSTLFPRALPMVTLLSWKEFHPQHLSALIPTSEAGQPF